ncbi:glycosyltransferase family 2 protein [Pedobacter namyangjuensis]|uniref:glycosyltransferase family 2 protein n=1 Tax=Pedobacter namyangjuensis TaxID=600626 RepID=UPI000DE2224B|nr:glycosyltransferase family 2 protein [Pedobacter namyangjuensis]
MNKNKVASVIVLYNPNWELLTKVINAASSQTSTVFVVDNSETDNKSEIEKRFSYFDNLVYKSLRKNVGIAKAQNIGVELVKGGGSEYIIFFDQDSIPVDGLVEALLLDFIHLRKNNVAVATIGPMPLNSQTNEFYKPRLRKNKKIIIENLDFYTTKQIISSGGLMCVEDFEVIGNFEEGLFIDGVDHEWCWRAIRYNYFVFLSPRATLVHSLGDGDKKILGIKIATTSSFRLYYQYRNYVILSFRSYVPTYWKLNNLIKYLIKAIYYPVVRKDLKLFTRIFTGIKDGFDIVLNKTNAK